MLLTTFIGGFLFVDFSDFVFQRTNADRMELPLNSEV